MKKTITIAVALCTIICAPSHAQFNTITAGKHVYRVETAWKTAEDSIAIKEMPQQGDTSYIASCDSIGAVTQPERQEERTRHDVDVSYPLHSITITSPFGDRVDPITGKRTFHNGIDLRANYEPVYAMLPGQVVKVGKDKSSGIYVTLRHGDFTVSYCHLSAVTVRKGDYVLAGSTVACSGNTGRSTGPHTHLTCKLRGKYIDPLFLLDFIDKHAQT